MSDTVTQICTGRQCVKNNHSSIKLTRFNVDVLFIVPSGPAWKLVWNYFYSRLCTCKGDQQNAFFFVNNRNAIHALVWVIEIATGIYTLSRKTVSVYSSHWYSLHIMLMNAPVSQDSVLTQFSVTLTESCVLRKRKGTINLSGHKIFYLNPIVTNLVDLSERASLPSFRMLLNLEDQAGYKLLQGRF